MKRDPTTVACPNYDIRLADLDGDILKGYLVSHGVNPPRTHDLDELRRLCKDTSGSFEKIADQCSDLTDLEGPDHA